MRTLLVDGDIAVYRFSYRGQEDIDWGGGVTTQLLDEGKALREIDEFLDGLKRKLKAQAIKVCLSGCKVFRYDVLSSYKHNRKGCDKPQLYHRLVEHLLDHYDVVRHEKLEADDCMGLLSSADPKNTVVCSIDKDLRQIPGWFYNWKDAESPELIPARQADIWFYAQALSGDPTDGFSGCPKIGKKRALAAVRSIKDGQNWESEVWKKIVELYAKAGLDESYALTQARVARILRDGEFDWENGRVKLWKPQA